MALAELIGESGAVNERDSRLLQRNDCRRRITFIDLNECRRSFNNNFSSSRALLGLLTLSTMRV